MTIRSAEAEWQGNVREGQGRIQLESGAFAGPYSFRSRTHEGSPDTNPEELLASAHAGCFTMSLAANLSAAKYTPVRIHTVARVHLSASAGIYTINSIDLKTEALVPGVDPATFQEIAARSEKNCPISKALAGTDIRLDAVLL